MLEVMEMIGGDGSIRIKRLVSLRADEELHGYGGTATSHDQEELQVLVFRGGKPWGRGVRIWVLSMELDVVKEMPQANYEEAKAWCNMSHQSTHISETKSLSSSVFLSLEGKGK